MCTETFITNPGIADRVEADVSGFQEYEYTFQRTPDKTTEICGILKCTHSSTFTLQDILNTNHLWVDVHDQKLQPSVGPFIRTLVRITQGSPHVLKVVLNFDWKEDVTGDPKDVSRKIAHQIHMLVRNSMGAALFLSSLLIVLPEFVKVADVQLAMNYPSIQLMEHSERINESEAKVRETPIEGESREPITVENYLDRKDDRVSARISVLTRMCTVRYTPILYYLALALKNEEYLPSTGMNKTTSQSIAKSDPYILACVDKPANLFRIIMLARDYDIVHRLVIVVRDEAKQKRLTTETDKFIKGLNDISIESMPKVLTIEETWLLFKKECEGSVVAVDLHEDALTLDQDSDDRKSALETLHHAKAIIWGFESDGIPSTIDDLATDYVQIQTRTSLNLVAAMSVVLHRRWMDANDKK
ncbi:hypothetical protein CTEN210_13572 [Chaetoceros tenuissimus]|uniref:Uncharacterized protein n=1 Tax=Chaetoceros tenuissimus TaxID=426638 RepID=A0AAD3D5K1_9STRA|nr:hypothetical protein CTEN210_13572 [Chaetoceros tenuissimus]